MYVCTYTTCIRVFTFQVFSLLVEYDARLKQLARNYEKNIWRSH